MESKICSKCKEEKELTEFAKRKDRQIGIASSCKRCNSIYRKSKIEDGTSKVYFREKRKRDYKDNKCSRCSNERLTFSKYCMKCWVEVIVNKWHLPLDEKKVIITQLIEKLIQSEFTCFYSGIEIIPGLTASVDHRQSQAKGGKHNIENLVWVHLSINRLKMNQDEASFIEDYQDILKELNHKASKQCVI